MALKKTHTSRPVERLSFNSRIDIIIPFHGKYDHVVRLVESLMRYTFSNLCQICLVDDCSPNSEFLLSLSKVPKRANTHRIKCVRLDEQRGFGGALQAGYEQTENPWTLFIHSDCVVEDVNWLRPLGECLLRHKEDGVRLVCPRTNNPLNGDPRQKGTRTDRVADAILEDGHLSLYCFMCHRELFEHVGGFIKPYPIGGYEDEEFAYRMRRYGFKQAICGNSWVFHEGEATIKEVLRRDPKLMRVFDENRLQCIRDIRETLR